MQCPYCHGTGRDPEAPIMDCPECGGERVVGEDESDRERPS